MNKLIKFYEGMLCYGMILVIFIANIFISNSISMFMQGIGACLLLSVVIAIITDFNDKSHII